MPNNAQKTFVAVKDRRIIRNPAEAFFDYWGTYAMGIGFGLGYFELLANGILVPGGFGSVIIGSLGVVAVAVTAARDGKKELHRKFEALVRRLDKEEASGEE